MEIKTRIISYSTTKLGFIMQKIIEWYLSKGFSQKVAEYFVLAEELLLV